MGRPMEFSSDSLCTPGAMVTSCMASRLTSGRLSMARLSMEPPRTELPALTSGTSAVTVTSVVSAPGCSVKFRAASCVAVSTMPVCTSCLNPGESTLTEYGPSGRNSTRYWPCPLVVVWRVKFVWVWVNASVAFGMAAPVESATVPNMVAVLSCARDCSEPLTRNRPSANMATHARWKFTLKILFLEVRSGWFSVMAILLKCRQCVGTEIRCSSR